MFCRNLGHDTGNKLVSTLSVLCDFVPDCYSFSDNYIALLPGTMKSFSFFSTQRTSCHLSEITQPLLCMHYESNHSDCVLVL